MSEETTQEVLTRHFELPLVLQKKATITWNKGKENETTKTVVYSFNMQNIETADELAAILMRPMVINETNRRRDKDPKDTTDGETYEIMVKKPGTRELTLEGYMKKLIEKHKIDPETGKTRDPLAIMALVQADLAEYLKREIKDEVGEDEEEGSAA